MKARSTLVLVLVALLSFGVSGFMVAQDAITSVCLVTDIGRVNDGSFNQSANDGMVRAAADFNLDTTYIETQAQTDYEANLQTCIDNGYDVVVVVGFLIYDATIAVAKANPDVYFIGIDQVPTEAVPNYVGVQYREDQAGFLAGAMAALMTETDKIGGIYGLDIPPVIKFRNGFEQGARFMNPGIELFGVYIPDFQAPQEGAEAAEAFIAEGVDVVFGAGGPTGSGGIVRAAELGAWVIGVDQDEYITTFGEGETPGADRIVTSAMKRVDNSVYDMIELLVAGRMLPSDSIYVMDASIDGIGFAPSHEAAVSDVVISSVQEIFDLLAVGDLTTGVDPVTGELIDENAPTATAPSGGPGAINSVCLVTDIGRIDDGSFNQSAYEGMLAAAEAYNLEYLVIETVVQADYESNISRCINEGYDTIVTVGFLISEVTAAAAALHPDVHFIGVDQFHSSAMPNLVGVQFREDQAGFLVGTMAAQLTETGIVAGVYGVEIPPVRKFRTGFEQGVRYINPDIEILGVFIPNFQDPPAGIAAAEEFIDAGADVVFGAGGTTASSAILRAAELGALVMGVDQDEYFTTFRGGEAPGADRIVTSAIKGVEQGVFDMIELLVQGGEFPDGSLYLMDASMNGVGFAGPNEAPVPVGVIATTQEVFDLLASGSLLTGVDLITGDLLGVQEPMPSGASGDTSSQIEMVCLVTDVGRINDATFNQYAYEGLLAVARDYDLEVDYFETTDTADYETNISNCINTGAQAIVTVGFMMTEATSAAAALNSNIAFIGVDQFHSSSLPNLVGVQFREDQAGFLAGVIAAQLSESGTIGGVYGIEIPPVRKFRAGYEQGAKYIHPDIEVLGEYIPDFIAPTLGAAAAERFIEAGADVIFGAGGLTGSGGIVRAADLGVWVIGVDQDEYLTTFEGGEDANADKIVSSAVKRVDQGVYDMIERLVRGEPFPSGSLYLMDASVNGIMFAPAHDADIPDEVITRTEEVLDMLSSGELTTGVDPITGDLMGGQ